MCNIIFTFSKSKLHLFFEIPNLGTFFLGPSRGPPFYGRPSSRISGAALW